MISISAPIPSRGEDLKIVTIKKGEPAAYDGFLAPRDRMEKLLVEGKDLDSCQADRTAVRLELSNCLRSQEVQWWNSTYFKITLGLVLGYTLARVEGKL